MAGLICSLDVRIAYVDAAGQLTGGGYIGLINPVNFTFEQPEPERIQRTSNLRDSFGNVLDEVVLVVAGPGVGVAAQPVARLVVGSLPCVVGSFHVPRLGERGTVSGDD